jgi:Mg-chelatase subunit ChlD
VGAFLLGIVNRAWWGSTPDCCHPDAAAAIEEVWPSVEAVIATHPPLQAPMDPQPWVDAYRASDLPALFAGADVLAEPPAMEMAVRLAQLKAWQITCTSILPVFERLLQQYGRDGSFLAQRQAMAFQRMLQQIQAHGIPDADSINPGRGDGGELDEDDEPLPLGPAVYHEVANRHAAEIHRLANSLLELAATEGRLKLRGRHSSGTHINLRTAVQAEADARLLTTVWQRPHVPVRPDPHFIVLVDGSSSMRGQNAVETFAGIVILREACRIASLPLSIIRFNSWAEVLESWSEQVSDANIPDIAGLLTPKGLTAMDDGLELAAQLISADDFRHPLVLVISDGKPNDEDAARAMIESMIEDRITILGLGLGPETAYLEDLVPDAKTNVSPAELPEVLASQVGEAMAALYGVEA